jgi:hypothetical protein
VVQGQGRGAGLRPTAAHLKAAQPRQLRLEQRVLLLQPRHLGQLLLGLRIAALQLHQLLRVQLHQLRLQLALLRSRRARRPQLLPQRCVVGPELRQLRQLLHQRGLLPLRALPRLQLLPDAADASLQPLQRAELLLRSEGQERRSGGASAAGKGLPGKGCLGRAAWAGLPFAEQSEVNNLLVRW